MSLDTFEAEGRFYRGNLHMHSTRSDGRLTPEALVDVYRQAGYDFVALTDHFMASYDWPVTDTRSFRSEGFTTLLAAELHTGKTNVGETWHLKAIGLPLDFPPPSSSETASELARRAAGEGAFIGIVHPSWYGLTAEDARTIEVAHAVEIYNHGSYLEVDRGSDWPFLDRLLNDGWRLTGYASDDAHFWIDDAFGGWVYVKSNALEPEHLLDALKAGRYYSSQGPLLHGIEVRDGQVVVHCSEASTIAVVGRGAKSESVRGCAMVEGMLPIERFQGGYFRVTVMDAAGARAWSNPIWMD